jgi:hypothetical protein
VNGYQTRPGWGVIAALGPEPAPGSSVAMASRPTKGISMITIILGKAFADRHRELGSHPTLHRTCALVSNASFEIDPEHIFEACNHIQDLERDVHGLARHHESSPELSRVLCQLRIGLELSRAPSMSVGDLVLYTSEAGEELGGLVVEPVGFKPINGNGQKDLRQHCLQGAHVHHVD